MLVYGDLIESKKVHDYLTVLFELLNKFEADSFDNRDLIIEILIEYGIFESALTDQLSVEHDCITPITDLLRKAGLKTGLLLKDSHDNKFQILRKICGEIHDDLVSIKGNVPNMELHVKVPEGYAYYSLYPEMYAEAAKRFLRDTEFNNKLPVVCLGIRNIGTSLSSVVAAELLNHGFPVHSFTVRPRGDYFDRELRLCNAFSSQLKLLKNSHFLIIDEGPGLSGSSFCCGVSKLLELGIQERNISFMPSWNPDGFWSHI